MIFFEIITISIGLAFDAFAVSLSSGTIKICQNLPARLRISFGFGFFQFIMPMIGWFLGHQISSHLLIFNQWIAFGILVFIGIKMITESRKPEQIRIRRDPSKGLELIILSLATSIDALAVGFSLALIDVDILYPAIVIGIVTALFSVVGVLIGEFFGKILYKKAEVLGGIILILIALKIIFENALLNNIRIFF
jgi:putative Mn2+ efflux pump MntP